MRHYLSLATSYVLLHISGPTPNGVDEILKIIATGLMAIVANIVGRAIEKSYRKNRSKKAAEDHEEGI